MNARTPAADPPPFGAPGISEDRIDLRDPRAGRVFMTVIKREGREAEQACVRNLSTDGAGLRSPTPPPIGEHVVLSLGKYGNVGGVVRWINGHLFGISLDVKIDPANFKFSEKDWAKMVPRSDDFKVADAFRPETSTWRPGFRIN